MKSRHLTQGMLVATIVGIAAMGCNKSASLRAGSGGVASEGGTLGAGGETGVGGGSGGTGGMTGSGGQTGTGGHLGTGGAASGGSTGAGGTVASGGTAGRVGAGGTSAAGGTVGRDGGSPDVPSKTGGAGSGGTIGMGGAKGGASGTGAGGTSGIGGSTTTVTIDCNAAMPTNGVVHSGNGNGTAGNLAWVLWSNGNDKPTMTTFDTPAFRMTWGPNSSDALARLGLDLGDGGMTYDKYGAITAQFAETKSGTAGGYSYIGVYGFAVDPCVEFYIIDDSYMAMPFKAWGASEKGTFTIDGASYTLFAGTMSSADSSSCRGSTLYQFYSVRQTARTCGQISITEHFNAWNAAGMKLGTLAELAIFVEVGGGTGSIDFPIANVTIQQ